MKIWPYDREIKAVEKINSWHLGMCYKDKQKIVVSTKWRKLQERNVTTAHEILHAVFHSYWIEAKSKEEEALVNKISLALSQVLHDTFPWVDLLQLFTNGKAQPTEESVSSPHYSEMSERVVWQPDGQQEHPQADWETTRNAPHPTGS